MENMNLKETYNKIAEKWFDEVRRDDWWEPGLEKFISLLKTGDTVFDVGCGPGITAKTFIQRGMRVVGFDFSEKMIEIAKREVPTGKFLVMDIKDIGSIDDTFDGIYVQNVLLHIPKNQIEATFKNIVPLLKKGGYMYVSVKERTPGKRAEEVMISNDYGYEYERFYSYFTQDEVKKYLQDFGFEILFFHIVHVYETNWIQVIGKKI